MTNLPTVASSEALNASPPAYLWVPGHSTSNGDLSAEVGLWLGFDEDPNQRLFLDAVFAEDEDGLPACFEVGLVAPRQNLKTAALQQAALTWLFVMRLELILWTAHLYDTSQKAYRGMVAMIARTPHLKAQCKWPPPASHGDEAIELLTGERIEFHARSTGGGRGITGNKVILDEAFALKASEMGALLPTMATRREAQVIYASSAGMLASAVLRGVRDRGRAGSDRSLAWLEWCAAFAECDLMACTHAVGSTGCAFDRRDLWAAANPALAAGRITMAALEKFRNAMPPMEWRREFLGWWDDPPNMGDAFDMDVWAALTDPTAVPAGKVSFGVAVAPDRSWAAIGVAWLRADGAVQVSVVEYAPTTAWVAARVRELKATYRGQVIAPEDVIHLAPDAKKATGAEQRQAHHAFDDALTARSLRHDGQSSLTVSVRAAKWRAQGDSRVLDRTGSIDISPLHAVALAAAALSTAPPLASSSAPAPKGGNEDTFRPRTRLEI